MKTQAFFTSVAVSALLFSWPATAQQTQQQIKQPQTQQMQQGQQQQVASQCLNDLRALSDRMNEEGYWLTGWGGRWGYGVDRTRPPRAVPPTGAGVPEPVEPATEATGPDAPRMARPGVGPWGDRRFGINSPSYQIRTLYESANVLAVRGDEQACNAVMNELTQLYDSYVQELQQAGVEPGEVAGWRREMILTAKPVQEFGQAINIADVTGTEIRNAQDERLGTVDDVVLDPQDGSIRYVVVSRGGFLGIGEEHVAVPWQALQATPGLNTFVLKVPEEAMEQAPKVDPDQFGAAGTFDQRSQEIDQYWQQQIRG